jgi:hypothetical protein
LRHYGLLETTDQAVSVFAESIADLRHQVERAALYLLHDQWPIVAVEEECGDLEDVIVGVVQHIDCPFQLQIRPEELDDLGAAADEDPAEPLLDLFHLYALDLSTTLVHQAKQFVSIRLLQLESTQLRISDLVHLRDQLQR